MSTVKDTGTEPNQYWLHPLSLADIPVIAGWHQHIDDLSLFDRRMPMPVSADAMEVMWKEIVDAREPKTCNWFVIDDSEDQTVGLSGIQDINYVHGDAVIATMIARSARRKGIAIRASALLLDLAFNQLRLTRVTTFYRADNESSRQLTRECGFKPEGCIRKGWFSGGRHVDVMVIGILAEEWKEHRKKLHRNLGSDTVVTFRGNSSTCWSWPPLETEGAVPAKAN